MNYKELPREDKLLITNVLYNTGALGLEQNGMVEHYYNSLHKDIKAKIYVYGLNNKEVLGSVCDWFKYYNRI